MVNMERVYAIEDVKKAVNEAWNKANVELHDLTEKLSEACNKLDTFKYDSREWNEAEEQIKTIRTAWDVQYGMTQMCSQLSEKLREMITAEYKADREAV